MRLSTIIAAAAVSLSSSSISAAEIKVLTAGAFKSVVTAMAPGFEQQTGHKIVIENDTAGALTSRIAGGEAFDLVVLTPSALQQLAQTGKVKDSPPRNLARVAIGVAVRRGDRLPDIATVAAFKAALQSARRIAMIDPAAGGSSGIYLTQLFEKMGIGDQIKGKAILVPGGLVAERLVNGEADVALHQVSEILAVPGAELVGPIPAEIQNYTTYAGAVSASARELAAAETFLTALAGAGAASVLKDKGMESPRF